MATPALLVIGGLIVTFSLAAAVAALKKVFGGSTTINQNSQTVNVAPSSAIAPDTASLHISGIERLPPGTIVSVQVQVPGQEPRSIPSNTPVLATDRGDAVLLSPGEVRRVLESLAADAVAVSDRAIATKHLFRATSERPGTSDVAAVLPPDDHS